MKSKLILCLALTLSESVVVSHAEETNATSATAKMVINVDVDGTTNSKTATLDIDNSSKGFAVAIASNFEKNVSLSTNATLTNMAALQFAREFAKTNIGPAIIDVGEAADVLVELKNKSQLPGVPKDSHGFLTTGVLPLPADVKGKYLPSVTFHLVLTGDTSTNHYTIGRMAKDAPLQLERAWRTDAQGRTITNWPIK